MSELDDIAAAAGIVIVDSAAPGDGGDADMTSNGSNSSRQLNILSGGSGDNSAFKAQISTFEAMFGHRYTMEDPDYAQTVSEADFNSRPPCVSEFREKRARDNFHRNRDGRGRGGGEWNRGGGGGGWDRGGGGSYNRHENYQRQSYRDRDDHYHRGHDNQHRDRDDGSRGYHHYQDRNRSRERY